MAKDNLKITELLKVFDNIIEDNSEIQIDAKSKEKLLEELCALGYKQYCKGVIIA